MGQPWGCLASGVSLATPPQRAHSHSRAADAHNGGGLTGDDLGSAQIALFSRDNRHLPEERRPAPRALVLRPETNADRGKVARPKTEPASAENGFSEESAPVGSQRQDCASSNAMSSSGYTVSLVARSSLRVHHRCSSMASRSTFVHPATSTSNGLVRTMK